VKQDRKYKYKRQKRTKKKLNSLNDEFYTKYQGKYGQPNPQEPGPGVGREDH
jgi:hypothetical protein